MRNIWDNTEDATVSLWRYFKPNRLLEFLETGKLYFSSAREFNDRFEGAVAVIPPDFPIDPRYSEMSDFDRAFEELRRLSKISCWHVEEYESSTMWQAYAEDGKGLALRTDLNRFLKACRPFFVKGGKQPETLVYGRVEYRSLLEERLRPNMEERFFYKDRMFSSEKEFRFLISLRMAEEFGVDVPEGGILVDFDLKQLIQDIYLGPKMRDGEREALLDRIRDLGFGGVVKKSMMLGTPRYF